MAVIVALTAALYVVVSVPALPSLLHGGVFGKNAVASLLLCAALVALSAIDTETYLLPDVITLPLVAAGLAQHWQNGNAVLMEHAVAAALAFVLLWGVALLYKSWRGRSGLGLGDAKLFAGSGAWLGPAALATVLGYAALAALASIAVASLRGNSVTLTTRIAFGPYLAFATWLVWLYGPIGFAPE